MDKEASYKIVILVIGALILLLLAGIYIFYNVFYKTETTLQDSEVLRQEKALDDKAKGLPLVSEKEIKDQEKALDKGAEKLKIISEEEIENQESALDKGYQNLH